MKNSIIYLWRMLAVCGLMVAFAACNNDDDDISGGNITIISPAESIICMATQEKHNLTFTAEGDWIAVPSHGWMKLNQVQGSNGEQTIEMTVVENKEFKERVGSIIVKDRDSGKSIAFSVKQGAMGSHFVFEEGKEEVTELLIDSEKKEIVGTVRVTSNYDWKINIPQEYNWLTYTSIKAEGGGHTLTFYAEPEKLNSYASIDAKISFDYVADTRAPGNQAYAVRFPGITPKLEISIDSEDGIARLEDPFAEGEYKARVTVSSNIAWDFNSLPDFLTAEFTGEVKPAKFFDTESTVFLTLKSDKLDTDQLDGNIIFKDSHASTSPTTATLPVLFAGVGNDFISFDSSVFPPDAQQGMFLFDAVPQVNQDKIEKMITVKSSNGPDDIAIYFAVQYSPWGSPEQIESYSLGADPIEDTPSIRTLVKEYKYTVWIKDRTYDYADIDKTKNRYFTIFVVSRKKAPTFDDLFDSDGYVKEEFMSSMNSKVIGQKGLAVQYNFYSPDLEDGQVLKVPATGKTFTINYETDAMGMSLYTNVVRYSEDQNDWNGGERVDQNNDMLELKFEENSVLKLTVKPNKTGEKRTESCGFGGYAEGQEQDLLLIMFSIEQDAE